VRPTNSHSLVEQLGQTIDVFEDQEPNHSNSQSNYHFLTRFKALKKTKASFAHRTFAHRTFAHRTFIPEIIPANT
jgi:hypothetical protein